ncbi:hypothetical protein ACJX0J_017183, partial [Zea mays]
GQQHDGGGGDEVLGREARGRAVSVSVSVSSAGGTARTESARPRPEARETAGAGAHRQPVVPSASMPTGHRQGDVGQPPAVEQ